MALYFFHLFDNQRPKPTIGKNKISKIKSKNPAFFSSIVSSSALFLIANPATRAIIREGNTHLIDNLLQKTAESGMVILESSLVYLLREGIISLETAQNYATRPQVLAKLLDV